MMVMEINAARLWPAIELFMEQMKVILHFTAAKKRDC
jgi:hypothetical protein